MRLDDDPDITLEEMLESARRFPFPLIPPTDALPTVSLPRQIRLPEAPLVVPDTCLNMVDGPLVGL